MVRIGGVGDSFTAVECWNSCIAELRVCFNYWTEGGLAAAAACECGRDAKGSR